MLVALFIYSCLYCILFDCFFLFVCLDTIVLSAHINFVCMPGIYVHMLKNLI